jgi:hypothetical protein
VPAQAAPGWFDPSSLQLSFEVACAVGSGLAVCVGLGILVVADVVADTLQVFSIRPDCAGLELRGVVGGDPGGPLQVGLHADSGEVGVGEVGGGVG